MSVWFVAHICVVCNSEKKILSESPLQTVSDVAGCVIEQLWPFVVPDLLEIFDPRPSNTYSGVTVLLSVEGSSPPSIHKERAAPLQKMKPLTSSGAIVTPPEVMEPQKLDFTSKWSDYWQQQPHPHAWLSRQQNVKWLHQCTELHIWEAYFAFTVSGFFVSWIGLCVKICALMLCVHQFSLRPPRLLCSIHMQTGWVQGFQSLAHFRCFLTSSWGGPVGLPWRRWVKELSPICWLTLPSINNVSFSFIKGFSAAFCCLCSMSLFDQNSM